MMIFPQPLNIFWIYSHGNKIRVDIYKKKKTEKGAQVGRKSHRES